MKRHVLLDIIETVLKSQCSRNFLPIIQCYLSAITIVLKFCRLNVIKANQNNSGKIWLKLICPRRILQGHKNEKKSTCRIMLTWTDGRTDGQCNYYMPPFGGIVTTNSALGE